MNTEQTPSDKWKGTLYETLTSLRRERIDDRMKKAVGIGDIVTQFLQRIPKTAKPLPPEPIPTDQERINHLKRDFHAVANQMVQQANKPGYVYNPEIVDKLNLIMNYFVGLGDMPTHKGLFLYGPPGCGKTLIMKVMAKILKEGFSRPGGNRVRENCLGFVFTSAPELCREEVGLNSEAKSEFFNNYGRRLTGWINELPFNHLCIDDLGKEETEKAYSYGKNPVKQILNDRYDRRQHGTLTHVTSNLNMEELGHFYGGALIDRFFEMFHLIEFHNDSFRN